jgi:2-dehydropantoate 2-reductase
MKIMVVGAGAMGSLFGGRLSLAGHEVLLVDVWREHVAAINKNGLIIDEEEEERRTVPVPACLPRDAKLSPELVIVFTKAYHTQDALNAVKGCLTADTQVLTLQNGLGHVQVIEQYVDLSRIIHGITTFPCDMVGPGHIRTQRDGYVKMMTADGHPHAALEAIGQAFNQAGLTCAITADTLVAIWEKLAFNAALNSMCAVLRYPVGALADAVEGRELVFQIMDEIVSVARRKNIAVDRERIVETLELAFNKHRDHMPSMLQDVHRRRKTEIDFINGGAIREGRALGMPLPANETVYRLVKTLEKAYLAGADA